MLIKFVNKDTGETVDFNPENEQLILDFVKQSEKGLWYFVDEQNNFKIPNVDTQTAKVIIEAYAGSDYSNPLWNVYLNKDKDVTKSLKNVMNTMYSDAFNFLNDFPYLEDVFFFEGKTYEEVCEKYLEYNQEDLYKLLASSKNQIVRDNINFENMYYDIVNRVYGIGVATKDGLYCIKHYN